MESSQSSSSQPEADEPELELDDSYASPGHGPVVSAPAAGGARREGSGDSPDVDGDDGGLELDDQISDARLQAAETARASGGPVPVPTPHRVALTCGACGAKQFVQTRSIHEPANPALRGGPFRRQSKATAAGSVYGWLSILSAVGVVFLSWGLGPWMMVFGWLSGFMSLACLVLGIRAILHIDIEYKWRPFMAGAGAGLALTALLWAMG